jgi:hypothetical protein
MNRVIIAAGLSLFLSLIQKEIIQLVTIHTPNVTAENKQNYRLFLIFFQLIMYFVIDL